MTSLPRGTDAIDATAPETAEEYAAQVRAHARLMDERRGITERLLVVVDDSEDTDKS